MHIFVMVTEMWNTRMIRIRHGTQIQIIPMENFGTHLMGIFVQKNFVQHYQMVEHIFVQEQVDV